MHGGEPAGLSCIFVQEPSFSVSTRRRSTGRQTAPTRLAPIFKTQSYIALLLLCACNQDVTDLRVGVYKRRRKDSDANLTEQAIGCSYCKRDWTTYTK